MVTQVAYLRAASGNRAQLVDDVRAAEYTTHTHLAALQAAKDAAHALQAKLSAEKKQADQAMADQQHLQATVTGQLAQLVQQAQARQAALAEQAAKARAGRRRAADRLARLGPGGRGSAPNPSGSGGSTPTTQPGTPPTTSPPSTQPVIPLPIPPGTPPPVLPAAVQAIAVARKYLGTAYQWGGDSPATGFDCSGLVQYSYGQVGISLPRVADEQAAATWHVSYAAGPARRSGLLRLARRRPRGHLPGRRDDARRAAHRRVRPHRADLVGVVGRLRPRRLSSAPRQSR